MSETHLGGVLFGAVVSETFEEHSGEVGQGFHGFFEKIAPCEQLHKCVGDLKYQVKAPHHIGVLAVAVVFKSVADFLFLESFVLNFPSHSPATGNFPHVVSVHLE